MTELEGIRARLRVVDEKLLKLISERLELGLAAGAAKRQQGLAIRQPEIEQAALIRYRQRAHELGLPEAEVELVFRTLIEISVNAQEEAAHRGLAGGT